MRIITIDFNARCIQIGYAGEHNAVQLDITVPTDLQGGDYYIVEMRTAIGERILSERLYAVIDKVSLELAQQVMQSGTAELQLVGFKLAGDVITQIGKSPVVQLQIAQSVTGYDTAADTAPHGYMAIKELGGLIDEVQAKLDSGEFDGADGAPALINGVNTLEIVAGDNISLDQDGANMTISATSGGGGDKVVKRYVDMPVGDWSIDPEEAFLLYITEDDPRNIFGVHLVNEVDHEIKPVGYASINSGLTDNGVSLAFSCFMGYDVYLDEDEDGNPIGDPVNAFVITISGRDYKDNYQNNPADAEEYVKSFNKLIYYVYEGE